MAKIPFLIRKGFNLEDRVEGNQLFVDMTPKKNLWFYLFAFIEAFKCICDMKGLEKESEDSNGR